MSPARKRHTPVPHRRSRADILKAAGAAAGIIVVTALLIWLTRPGPTGTAGTGGLMGRQPRVSLLIGAALGLAAVAMWWVLRVSRTARERAKIVLPVALGVVLVAALVGAATWPGGVLRHDIAPPPLTTIPRTTTTFGRVTTTTGGGTTTSSAASTTTTPTTGTATTTSP